METQAILLWRRRAIISILSVLIALCFALPGARAQNVPVRLLLGKREVPISPSPIFDGKRVLAPVSVLDQFKLSYGAAAGGKTLTIIDPNGSPADVEIVDVNGTRMVPMDQVLKIVGGDITTDPNTKSATIRAHLKSVEFVDNALRINCSLPVTCSVKRWQDKLIVDIPDARLVSEAREVYVGGETVAKVRLGQYNPDTARVVLDTVKEAGYRIDTALPAGQITVTIGQGLPAPAKLPPALAPPKEQPFTINAIRIEPIDERSFKLVVDTSCKGSVNLAQSPSPPEVTLILKGATISDTVKLASGTHALVKEVRFAQATREPPLARVHLNLNRLVFSRVHVEENAIAVTLTLPDKAGGTLAEKVVVIDPGHGGNQCGARAANVNEKDLNIKLAAELASALNALGVTTILTRETDATMDLASRPAVAVNNKADFFISLHCNSNLSPNSRSGIETYYYRYGDSSPLLAQAVQKAVCCSTGMRDGNARKCGFMVLHLLENTGIPGVLVECGYLNHSGDRVKLLDANYRKKLAAGIAAGLKTYVEGIPIQ